MSSNTKWLPNLVEGVSIWKLARDLNEDKFMGGRLLVPETEGSDSLPTSIQWNLEGLVPLAEARAAHPADVEAATKDFFESLDRVAKTFGAEDSAFHKYKSAFTVPSIDADGGANYFYDPAKKRLAVINWGSSPRSFGAASDLVFGWESFDKWAKGAAAAAPVAAAAPAVAAAAAAPKPEDEKKDEEKKDDEKKDDDKKGRPWWMWLLFGLGVVALLLLILWLLKACEDQKNAPGADAATDAMDAAALVDGDAEAGADAAGDGGDAGDAAADAKDAASDAKDSGKDGSVASNDDDDDDDGPGGSSGGGGGGGGGGGSSGGGGGPKKVISGPAGLAKGGPHRQHFHKDATDWRVSSGMDKVRKAVVRGNRFDVYLGAGKTFEGVRVEYKDAGGAWHAH